VADVLVEGNGTAVGLEIPAQTVEIGRRALARHEAKLHQLTRGIVDEDQQGAGRAPILEPAVLAAVDLDQFAVGLPPSEGTT
jgi:hypothetical protein